MTLTRVLIRIDPLRSPVEESVDREVSSFRSGYSDNSGLQVESSSTREDESGLHDKSFSADSLNMDEDGDDQFNPDEIVNSEDDDDLTYEAGSPNLNNGMNASEDRIARH
jgi:hypothetical protein